MLDAPGHRRVLVGFLAGEPPEQLDLARVRPEYYTWASEVEADGLDWFTVHPGPILDQAMHARYQAIRAYLEHGMNVIADDVIWKRDWLVDALRVFEGCWVWMVGVHVADGEGARREQERGDRHPAGTGAAPAPPMPTPTTTSNSTPRPPRPRRWRANCTSVTRHAGNPRLSIDSANAFCPEIDVIANIER